jgi:hypothetical protein
MAKGGERLTPESGLVERNGDYRQTAATCFA